MKNEKMLHAIGEIDDDMIEDAVIQPGQKKQPFVRTPAFRTVVAIAACLVLVIGLTLYKPAGSLPHGDDPNLPPIEPGTLLPPMVQGDDQQIRIQGLDQLSYYAAVRMIAGTPMPAQQRSSGSRHGITLLTSGEGTDVREDPPEPQITEPGEGTDVPVVPTPSTPPVIGEDVYYYALDPAEPFYINKVSMFQIELTDEDGFLASKLGLGIVDVVILEECIWGENMITFRNGDNFYSCLSDGGGVHQLGFSTHKFVEGFYIVKNIAQENYGFYIDLDEQGQVIAFECGERENGGDRVDQNVRVVSSTVISHEGRSFTVAELEDYFNSGALPEATVPPADSGDTLPEVNKESAV